MYTDWLLKMKENEAQTTLEERVVELLAEHKMTVTTAESCTGGLIAATLVNVPGAVSYTHLDVYKRQVRYGADQQISGGYG